MFLARRTVQDAQFLQSIWLDGKKGHKVHVLLTNKVDITRMIIINLIFWVKKSEKININLFIIICISVKVTSTHLFDPNLIQLFIFIFILKN